METPQDYLTRAEMKDLIEEVSKTAVRETLTSMGMSSDDPIEMQHKMQFLSDLYNMNNTVKSASLKGVIGLLITATGALLVMGIRYWFLKR